MNPERSPVVTAIRARGFEDMVYARQITGARRYQEDSVQYTSLGHDPDGADVLMVLADGMGGHRGGAEASRIAVRRFDSAFRDCRGGLHARLRSALHAANADIGAASRDDSRLRGMGCTLVACVVTEHEQAHWISVGDSLLWHVHNREGRHQITRLNEDHSMKPVFSAMVREGAMTQEEAARGSHQLRSALTGDDPALIDEGRSRRIGAGDFLILASDGVETLSEKETRTRCAGTSTVVELVNGMLAEIERLNRPSQDNATLIAYKHTSALGLRRQNARLNAPTQPLRAREAT